LVIATGISANPMLPKLKHQWTQLKHYPPGQRFRRRYEARRQAEPRKTSLLRHITIFSIAAVLAVIGFVLVFMPGPAVLFFFLSGAVLAEESLTAARVLDWLEVRLRHLFAWARRWWARRSTPVRVLLSLSVALVTGASAYLSYQLLF
jgi:hypothetical protein